MGVEHEILNRLDVNQLADFVGTDPDHARKATTAAVPALLSGLRANISEPGGASALAEALEDHRRHPAHSTALVLTVSESDLEEGRKIVAYALADDSSRLAEVSNFDPDILARLLPALAPIVMRTLANQFNPDADPDELNQLIGSLLRDTSDAPASGLSDLLGGLLNHHAVVHPVTDEPDLDSLLGHIIGN